MNNWIKKIFLAATAFCLVVFMIWLAIGKPWEKTVFISTTRDAFVGPHPGTELITIINGKAMLSLGITPAPWPSEAQDIWEAARNGKRVHIKVLSKNHEIFFDVHTVSQSGNLLVQCQSVAEAKRIATFLGISS